MTSLFHTFKINSFINNKQNNVFTIKCTSPDITTWWTGIAEGSNPICVHECFMQKLEGLGLALGGEVVSQTRQRQFQRLVMTCLSFALPCWALPHKITELLLGDYSPFSISLWRLHHFWVQNTTQKQYFGSLGWVVSGSLTKIVSTSWCRGAIMQFINKTKMK